MTDETRHFAVNPFYPTSLRGIFRQLLALGAMALCLGCGSITMAQTAAPGFVQDRFAIGLWVEPPASDADGATYYKDIAEANLSLVIAISTPDIPKQLELCKLNGLKAIVNATGSPDTFPEDEACWGYLMIDEPNAKVFPALAKNMQAIYKARPGRLGYINLFPNYATPEQLGARNYDDYVAKFVRDVKPQVLSMDHYPSMRPEQDTRESYCENLETMRKHSLLAGIPFWNFFYSMPFNDRIDPTEAQIRWQIYTSVAYGAKGVLYFCYWTPGKGAAGKGEFPKGGALITAEGRKTRHWDEARRINGELKHLGPTLMSLTSTGVYRVNTGKRTAKTLAGSPVKSITKVHGDPEGEFIVGAFKGKDGKRAVLILNHNYSYTAWPTVEFEADPTQVMEVDKATGQLNPVIDDSPELEGLQLSLGAGDGRLFVLPN